MAVRPWRAQRFETLPCTMTVKRAGSGPAYPTTLLLLTGGFWIVAPRVRILDCIFIFDIEGAWISTGNEVGPEKRPRWKVVSRWKRVSQLSTKRVSEPPLRPGYLLAIYQVKEQSPPLSSSASFHRQTMSRHPPSPIRRKVDMAT